MSETGKAGALSRWEDEGGALPCGPQEALAADCEKWDIPPLSDAEIIQLRIRVIALENMVLGLLSKASADQLAAIEEIAEFISPRADAKPHPLTLHAATQMEHPGLLMRRENEAAPHSLSGTRTRSGRQLSEPSSSSCVE